MRPVRKDRFITCEICKYRAVYVKGEKRNFMARFPKDEKRCKQWVKAVGNEDLIYVPIEKLHTLKYVCGDHFENRCFNKKKSRLKKSSVPTRNLNAPPIPDKKLLKFPLHIYSKKKVTANEEISDDENSQFQVESTAGASDSDSSVPYRPQITVVDGNILIQPQIRTQPPSPVETQADSSDVEGKCFCCLVEGEHELASQYLGTLRKCLNLIVMPTRENALRMCAECVSFVDKVQTFREMVRTSQTQLQGAFGIMVPIEETCGVPETAPDKTEMKEVCQKLEESVVPSVDHEVVISKTENDISTDDEFFDGFNEKSTEFKTQMDSDADEDFEGDKGKNAEPNESSSVKKKQVTKKDLAERKFWIKERQNMRLNVALILYHSTIVPFRFGSTAKCFYCPKLHLTFQELKEHTLTEHSDQTEDTIYALLKSRPETFVFGDISCIQCKICQEKIDSIENLIEHLKKRHYKTYYKTTRNCPRGVLGFDMSTDTPKCHICQKEFARFAHLRIHMNDHYGYHVCYVCGKLIMSELRYASHIKTCHKTREAKCKFCNEVMLPGRLEYHMNRFHIKRVIKCSMCPKTFRFGAYKARSNHMIKEHGLRKPVYRCDPCNKEYSSASGLYGHRSYIHKWLKEFNCDICGYITTKSTLMNRHMDIHSGVKRYKCSICNKKLANTASLNRHMKIHKNDKRYACELCDAAFIQKCNLQKHYKSKHPDSDVKNVKT